MATTQEVSRQESYVHLLITKIERLPKVCYNSTGHLAYQIAEKTTCLIPQGAYVTLSSILPMKKYPTDDRFLLCMTCPRFFRYPREDRHYDKQIKKGKKEKKGLRSKVLVEQASERCGDRPGEPGKERAYGNPSPSLLKWNEFKDESAVRDILRDQADSSEDPDEDEELRIRR